VRKMSPTQGFFFLGFPPLIHLCTVLNPFCPSCHFTFHATVLTTNTTQKGFEPMILASERPKTHAVDRTATGSAIRSPDRPARSLSLYRLRYPGPDIGRYLPYDHPFTTLVQYVTPPVETLRHTTWTRSRWIILEVVRCLYACMAYHLIKPWALTYIFILRQF
jgi:hypothetical protein